MPRMLDLMRQSQVPANLMQAAARGSLSLPPAEIIEILVHLALHHKVYGEQARLTLAGWDEKASVAAASDPATSPEVLGYFASLENLRTQLLPALAENPAVGEQALCDLAGRGTRPVVEALLASPRVMGSRVLLTALESNVNLRPNELAEIEGKLKAPDVDAVPHGEDDASAADPAAEEALAGFLKDNAADVESHKDKAFQPIGAIHDFAAEAHASAEAHAMPVAALGGVEGRVATGTAAAAAARRHVAAGHVERRDSTLQKIAKLDIKGRIALAIRGGKEERSILIRDGTKVVALAVLESPKLTDTEVEGFAQQKNVLETVLRTIPLKRRFAKNYNVTRNLVFNPRTPIDLSLGLLKGLLVHDLKNLSGNKEVSETIRKLALRMYRQKMETKKRD